MSRRVRKPLAKKFVRDGGKQAGPERAFDKRGSDKRSQAVGLLGEAETIASAG